MSRNRDSMLRPSIETLFERFLSGNVAALGLVFDRTAPELLGLARHLSRDAASAEDLVQATFLAAIEGAQSWNRRERVLPWLLGILANLARMERRREARCLQPERVPRAPSLEDPAATCATRELGDDIERKIEALPAPYRSVLVLHLLHGLSASEIARAHDVPAGTVRSQITRGLTLLRRALPAGLTATSLAVAPARAALARVRARVLEHAGGACSTASAVASLSVVVGAWMMKAKVVLACTVVALAGGGLWLAGLFDAPDASLAATISGGGAVADDRIRARGAASQDAEERALGSERLPAVDAATGSLRVRARWHDGAPAAGVVVSFVPADLEAAGLHRRWRTTDGVGEVLFEGLQAGRADVSVLRGGQSSTTVECGKTAHAEIEIPRGIDVRGRVIEAGSGKPIADASVGIVAWPDVREVARTDRAGRFLLRSVDRSRRCVQAWAAGYKTSPSWPLPKNAPAVALEIPLGLGAGIVGTVRDSQGRPIADALVLCGSSFFAMAAPGAAAGEGPQTGPSAPLQTSSDSSGEFALTGVPVDAEAAQLWVAAAGFACFSTRVRVRVGAAVRVDVMLERGVILRGIVRDIDGHPVARASVQVFDRFSAPEGIEDERPSVVRTSVTTKADGAFVFPNLAAGKLEARVSNGLRASPMLAAYRAFEAAPGETVTWNPVLEERTIEGRLIDDLGQPLARWRVGARASSRTPYVAGGTTDEDGLFAIRRCVDVPYTLWVSDRAIPVLEQLGVMPGRTPLTLVVPHEMQPSARVVGETRDADGGALSGVHVGVVPEHGDGTSVWSAAGGRFETPPVLPGAYLVEASHSELGALPLGRHELAAGQTLDLGTVRFPKTGALELRVRDARGEPWSGRLLMSRRGDRHHHWLEVRDGELEKAALVPGSYFFHGPSQPPLCFAAPPVEVHAGETARVRIDGCAGGWRKLRFATAGRVPLSITLLIRDHTGRICQRTGFSFWLDADADHDVLLPFGSYEVEARTSFGRSAKTAFDISAHADLPAVDVRLP